MPRETTTALIARVRRLAGNVPADVLSDDELEAMLDAHALHVVGARLEDVRDARGRVMAYASPYAEWESGAVLDTGSGTVLEPAEAAVGEATGLWTFAAEQTTGPAYVTGTSHDTAAAAADALEAWAAALATAYDFSSDAGQSFRRSQAAVELRQAARALRARARPVSSPVLGSA
jgi:hypothetical protein